MARHSITSALPPLAPKRNASHGALPGLGAASRTTASRFRATDRARSPSVDRRINRSLHGELDENPLRSSSLPPIDVPDGFGQRRRSESREPFDKTRSGSRGRRSPSEGRSLYEQECERCLILPKFARNAETALNGEELDLGDLGLGDAQFGALLADTVLVPAEQIRCWKLCGDRLTHIGAAALGSVLRHGAKVINLARNELGAKGVEAVHSITKGHRLTQLRSLNLSSNGLRNDAIASLCNALLECQLLLRLDLNCNEIREGASLGGLVAEHANITRLAVHGNFLNGGGGATFFRGVMGNIESGGRLADVDLAWNGLGEGNGMECAKALAAVLSCPSHLFHLDLSYNGLDADCCTVVANAMRDNHQLYGLHMVGNAVVIDSNGFLTPLKPSGQDKWATAPSSGLMFGDPRSGPRQLVGAAKRCSGECRSKKLWTDDDILRDRDPLEHQSSCWACEGWELAELCWRVQAGEAEPRAVWAFTSLDRFRSGMRLKLQADGMRFLGTRMVPPGQRLLVIFQVDTSMQVDPEAPVEDLEEPVAVELCFCKELPKPSPSKVHISKASVASVERARLRLAETGLAGQRVVLLDGPDGPVCLPRTTESDFLSKVVHVRQKHILSPFRRDTEKILRNCFVLDWSMVKRGRLIPEVEDERVAQVLQESYAQIVALYRQLSAFNVAGNSDFGVSSLEAGNLATESGLVDGTVTRISDIDRLFIASTVKSTEQKRELRVRNDKKLVRFQFLEFLLRIADQHFRQTREVSSMTEAAKCMLEQLQPIAEARLTEMSDFFTALHTDEVDEVYRKHLSGLEAMYRRFSGRTGPTGYSSFMSHGQFQDLLERTGAYDSSFQQRQSGVAFRMGMTTHEDEYYNDKFQEMSLLEFLHALAAVVSLRADYSTERAAELLDDFFSKQLSACGIVSDVTDGRDKN